MVRRDYAPFLTALIAEIRQRNYSIRTEKVYELWACRFILINNPAASYLAARSGALQLPVQTLRRLNKNLRGKLRGIKPKEIKNRELPPHSHQAKPGGTSVAVPPNRIRGIFRVRSAIDVHPDSPFVGKSVSRYCMRAFFSCFRQAGFCCGAWGELSAIVSTEAICCSFTAYWWNRCACSTLRFYIALNSAEQKNR